MNTNCIIPISPGELYDRYSILQIKSEKIKDIEKLASINKEIDYLTPYINKYKLNIEFLVLIKNINEALWDIEDKIREKEKKQEFDDEFILLARSVYKQNDQRSYIKNKINISLNSDIKDIKSYC